jgi:DNA-binding NarL/FixJ family response regulator
MAFEPRNPLEGATVEMVEPHDSRLTSREQDVLALVTLGMSNREIAVKLNVGVSTVKAHLSSVFWKLGVSNRTQAALAGHAVLPRRSRSSISLTMSEAGRGVDGEA